MFNIDNTTLTLEKIQMKQEKNKLVSVKEKMMSIRPDFKLSSKLESLRYFF